MPFSWPPRSFDDYQHAPPEPEPDLPTFEPARLSLWRRLWCALLIAFGR